MKKLTVKNIADLLIIGIFVIAIFLPFTLGLLSKDQATSAVENRTLTTLPKLALDNDNIKQYPQAFNQYYADHFGLRDFFITQYKRLKLALGDSPSKKVILGEAGWLFLGPLQVTANDMPSDDPIGDYRNLNHYSEADLQTTVEYFAMLNQWLEQQDIQYLFMIAPSKHTIYGDKLPNYIAKEPAQSVTNQLIEELKAQTHVTVIDLRKALLTEKNNAQLYYKIDTHWNHHGANVAQYEIMKTLGKLFPSATSPTKYPLIENTMTAGDLSRFIGINGFHDIDPQPIFDGMCEPTKSPENASFFGPYSFDCQGKTLNGVFFRDSFFTALVPYFSRQLGRSTFIWKKPTIDDFKHYIQSEQPDFIIEEWVERHLPLTPTMPEAFNKSLTQLQFSCSQEILFENHFADWTLNNQLATLNNNGTLQLQATDSDPTIQLPKLSFEAGKKYILSIELNSTIDGNLQLFYSDKIQPEPLFTEARSLMRGVQKGNNHFYLRLDQPNLGELLRLDPINTKGGIEIKKLSIKSIEPISKACFDSVSMRTDKTL